MTVGSSEFLPAKFPANFVAESSGLALDVVGPDVTLAGGEQGLLPRGRSRRGWQSQSGPSDFAECPRPIIVSAPMTGARKGVAYRYPVSAIRSLGDLRTRVVNGKETMNFWDVERLRFEIERGPRWLAIDRSNGLLSGTPDQTGETEVVVSVTLERDVRLLEEASLKWGIEKVVSSVSEKAGNASQRFVIEVRP